MILRHVVSSCAKINQIMVIDCEMMIENEFRMLALLCRLLLSTCLLNKICYRTRVSPSIGCKRMTLQYMTRISMHKFNDPTRKVSEPCRGRLDLGLS